MKAKWISIFLVFAMMFSMLTACNNADNGDDIVNNDGQEELNEDNDSEVKDMAEAVKLIADGSVESMCIDEGWKVRPDHNNEGVTQQWYNEVSGTDIEIPANSADVTDYSDVAWFTVEFESDLNVSSDQRVYLQLAGSGIVTTVWLNGIEVGSHVGSFGEFSLDITDAIKHDGKNILAVCSSILYEGYSFTQLPVGSGIPKIAQPVYIYVKPEVSIMDTYVHPSTEDGSVEISVTVNNSGSESVEAVLGAKINEKLKNMVIDRDRVTVSVPVGESTHELSLQVKNFKYWSPDDPQLYDVTIDVSAQGRTDEVEVRTGFKDLRVDEDGFFVLNGERFYVKSTHSNLYVLDSIENAHNLDMYYNLLLYLKSCGFNTVRYIQTPALPQILEMCAEIGLLVYEEHTMGWLKKDTDKAEELFHLSISDILQRDKNYVSLGMFGMLNETFGTSEDSTEKIFNTAVKELSYVREVAPHLLVMLSSGRWDGIQNLGSASNPYSNSWDGYMGNESADNISVTKGNNYGYANSMGDIHYYPHFPIASDARNVFEQISATKNAVFISEFGMGSQANIIREYLFFDHNDATSAGMPFDCIKQQVVEFKDFYKEYGLDSIWATPEAVLKATQEYQSKQRAYEFTMIRRNDNINGFSTTMSHDCGFRGEGLMEDTGYAKVGATEMFQENMSDLRFCITVENPHIWSGEGLDLEIVVSDWGVLKNIDYPVEVRITSDNGTVWEKSLTIRPGEGDIISVVDEIIPTDGWASGTYKIGAEFLQGAHADCGTSEFYITNESDIQRIDKVIYGFALNKEVKTVLEKFGATVVDYKLGDDIGNGTLILGSRLVPIKDRHYIFEAVENGAHVIVLKGDVISFEGKVSLPWGDSPIAEFGNWLYHYDEVVFDTNVMSGLQTKCILNAQYYDDVYSDYFIESATAPTETHIATFFAGIDGGSYRELSVGYKLGTYEYGKGFITINTLNLISGADTPVGTSILCNLVNYQPNK